MQSKINLVKNCPDKASDVCDEMREKGMGVVSIVEDNLTIASMGYELNHYDIDDINSNPKWTMACLIAAGQSEFEGCDLTKNYRIVLLSFIGMLFSGSHTLQWLDDHKDELDKEAGRTSTNMMRVAIASFQESSAETFDKTPPETIVAALYMVCAKHNLELSDPRIPLKILMTEAVTYFCESTPVGEMIYRPEEIGNYADNIITAFMRSRKAFAEGYYRDVRKKMH